MTESEISMQKYSDSVRLPYQLSALSKETLIRMVFNQMGDIEKLTDRVRQLEEKELLSHESEFLVVEQITYEEAKSKVIEYLRKIKGEGAIQVSDVDIAMKLKIPIEQVEKILNELKR